MQTDTGDRKSVAALAVASAHKGLPHSLTSSTLPNQEQQLMLAITEQQAKQDEQVKQQHAPSVAGGEEQEVQSEKPKKGLALADSQQQSQELSTLACCSKEMGLERREGGSREQLYSLASSVAEEGGEIQQPKGAVPQQRYRGKAELCDEDEEDEEEEQQQLPSTVDSVASSTDSNGLGGGRITAELHEALCGTSSAAAAHSVLACAKKLRGLSRTTLLVAAAAPETPTLQAFCDDPAVPAMPLPLPAPFTEAPKAGAAHSTEAALKSEGDKDMNTLAGAVALKTANEGGRRTAEDAAPTLAGGELQMKKDDGEQQTLVRNATTTTTAVAVGEMGCGTAALKTTTAPTATAVLTDAGIETGVEGRQEEHGRGDRAAKMANERDVHGTWSAGKEEESAIMSFRMHSRSKQSAAEQGRIAAAAVAAATRLFSRGETGKSSSSSSLAKEEQQKGIQLPQLQKRSAAVGRGEEAGSSSLTAPGHTTYALPHPLQKQQQQQEKEEVQQAEEAEKIDWIHHGKERQEERRLLPCFDTEEQQQQPWTDGQVLRQQQTKKPQERQQEKKHSLFTKLLAAELREEERNMLRTFCCAEGGEIAAATESPALLLSQGGRLFSNKSGIEQDQQQLQRAEKLWTRSDTEAEDHKRLLVGQTYFDSSTSSLSSLLQQQADTSALLLSAAAVQHDVSTKNSSLATFSSRKTSPAGNFASGAASAAAAINKEITDALVAAASGDDRTMWGAREDVQMLKREEMGDVAPFQKTTGDRERTASLSTSERDVMLWFMDLPRVLSLATQASSPDRAAFDQLQQAAAFSSHKAYNTPTSSAIAAVDAAAASGSGGDAATAARAASPHAFSPAAAASRKPSATVPHQQAPLCPDSPTATDAPAGTSDGVATPAACLSGAQSGVGRVEEALSSPVPSLCLQAAMRPPPGLDTHARERVAQDLEHVLRSDDPSTLSTAVATTASALLSPSSGRRRSAAAALFASATQKSLAAAVAALAAAAGAPMGSGAVVPRGAADGGLSPAAADLCRQGGLFSADEIIRVAAAAAAGVGGNSCSNISDRADMLNAESSIPPSTTPSWRFPQRQGSSGSNPLYNSASKHFLLAALAREAEAGAREADAGGAALAAAVAARQQGQAMREGEKLWLSQPLRVGGAGGEAATMVGIGGRGDGFSTEKAAPGRGCSRLYYAPSCQGDLCSISAGEKEGRAEPVFVRKQQVAVPLQKHRETQLRRLHEGGRLMPRCGREIGAAGSLRLFDAVAEGRTGRRAATEGRDTAMEGGRAAGCASAFSSNGGRRYSGTGNSMARQAWLRKGEYLELLELQQQRGGGSRNAAYGGGIADRNIRKAVAAREKPAPEPQKDGFKVFFGNASALTTEEEMYGLFRKYGECSELILLRDRRQRLRGAGFVTFKNAADAMRAIDGLDRKYTVLMVERLKDTAARASCGRPSTGTAEDGSTKPLEVRVPENSEQKRERIRALARLRAENAQQQSQIKQHQQGIQQHLQQEYHPCQQVLQGSPQQQYTQQQRTLLTQPKPQQYNNILHHPSHCATSQRQQYSQQQHQYSEQQLHPYYEQQHRRAPTQPTQQQQRVYSEQQQRGGEPLQAPHGYALSNVCERVTETTGALLWQSGNAHLLEASRGSVMCSPIKGEKSEAATAASPHPTTALETLLAAAAAQQQQTQQRGQDQTSCLAGSAAEGAQDLLAWLERYTRYGEGGSVTSALADKQEQQKQKQEPQHAVHQNGNVSTGISRTAVSLFHEPFSRRSTLHLDNTADQIVAACIGEQSPQEEGEYWRKALNISPCISQDFPFVTLNQALTAAFPSPKTTNGVASDRISCSTATPTGASAWQGPVSAMMDQKTIASPIPRVTSAARSSPAVASPSSSEDVDAFPTALSTAASDGTAPVTAAAGARVEPPGSGISPAACEETDLSYVNAVANMLSGRTLPSGCGERDSAAASLSSRAPPSRYAASPCSYSRLAPSDAAFLQSASTASPAALSPFLAPFASVEKPGRVPDSELHDTKAPAAAAATPPSSLVRMRLSPPQQQDGGSRFHPDMYSGSGSGKRSEPGTNNPSVLRETD